MTADPAIGAALSELVRVRLPERPAPGGGPHPRWTPYAYANGDAWALLVPGEYFELAVLCWQTGRAELRALDRGAGESARRLLQGAHQVLAHADLFDRHLLLCGRKAWPEGPVNGLRSLLRDDSALRYLESYELLPWVPRPDIELGREWWCRSPTRGPWRMLLRQRGDQVEECAEPMRDIPNYWCPLMVLDQVRWRLAVPPPTLEELAL